LYPGTGGALHGHYSGFDSALYRSLEVEWLFSQEKATLQHIQTSTREAKAL